MSFLRDFLRGSLPSQTSSSGLTPQTGPQQQKIQDSSPPPAPPPAQPPPALSAQPPLILDPVDDAPPPPAEESAQNSRREGSAGASTPRAASPPPLPTSARSRTKDEEGVPARDTGSATRHVRAQAEARFQEGMRLVEPHQSDRDGFQYVDTENLNKGLRIMEEARLIDPSFIDPPLTMASLYHRMHPMKHCERILSLAKAAIALDPNNPDAKEMAALAYFTKAQALMEEKEWKASADYFRRAHELEPFDAQAFSVFRLAAVQAGQHDVFVRMCEAHLEKHPDDPSVRYTLARALINWAMKAPTAPDATWCKDLLLTQAEDQLKRFLATDPLQPDGNYWLACVLSLRQRYDEARQIAVRLSDVDPVKGKELEEQLKLAPPTKKSIAPKEEFPSNNPPPPPPAQPPPLLPRLPAAAKPLSTSASNKMKETDDRERKTNEARAWKAKAAAHSAAEQWDRELACHDRVLQLLPEDANTHFNKGLVLRRLDRPIEAIQSFDRALELNPDDADCWYNRGAALHDRRNFDGAITSYERVVAINPHYAEAWADMGDACEMIEDWEGAIESYSKFIALAPPDSEGRVETAEIRVRMCRARRR